MTRGGETVLLYRESWHSGVVGKLLFHGQDQEGSPSHRTGLLPGIQGKRNLTGG
jgi:hypothetical protein